MRKAASSIAAPCFPGSFRGIAGFILLMAGINFMNISIAASLKRAKEVGVRKIAGGQAVSDHPPVPGRVRYIVSPAATYLNQ